MFKFRPSVVEGKPGSLYVQFIKDRKSRSVVLKGYKFYPHEWDEESESFRVSIGNTERKAYLESIHAKLMTGRQQVYEAIRKLEIRNPDYSVDEVIENYLRRQYRNNLTAYAGRLADRIEESRPRTARSYRCVARRIQEFYGGDVPLDRINADFIKRFEAHLLSKGKKPNTTSYYCRNLRAILNRAIDEKIIENPQERLFSGVFTGNEKTEKRAVKREVIETLENLKLTGIVNKQLLLACHLFLLSYYLRGISFIDLAYLKKANIRDGCILYTRHKTGQRFEIEITPKIEVLLNNYQDDDSDYLLPVLRKGDKRTDYENALKQENNRLKQLSALIGLDKPLTTYVARHSWASNAYAMGVSIDLISQGLGHENVRTTMIYLKSFDYSNLHEANRKVIYGTQEAV